MRNGDADQARISLFQQVLAKAEELDAAQWAAKHQHGWGSDCAISGLRQTEDAAANWHKTGILYGKGAYPEGHVHSRRGFMDRTIVVEVDERRHRRRVEQAEYEWLFGRACSCCGRTLELNSRNFHLNHDGLCGFRRECKRCRNGRQRGYDQNERRKHFLTSFRK